MSETGGAPHGAPPATVRTLAPHVCATQIGASLVLLDLRRDRYLAAGVQLQEDGGAIAGGEAALQSLAREGVFEPRQSWALFVRACVFAHRAIANRRLDRALRHLERLRNRHHGHVRPEALVAAFDAMRPWWPRRMVCLFDSLALMAFLLPLGVEARMVFGVRLAPFAAHCWIEQDDRILNDEASYCASFTPILKV